MKAPYNEFEWDEFNSEKNLKKHGVSDTEVEQVFENTNIVFPHKQFDDRRIVLGITNGGRYLFMSIQHRSKTCCRPIHARDMKKNEQSLYKKNIKRSD